MLKSILTNTELALLPSLVALCFFVFFITTLVWMYRRGSKEHYSIMSKMALDGQENGDLHGA